MVVETVGDLIEELRNYDANARIVLYDGWLSDRDFHIVQNSETPWEYNGKELVINFAE